MLTVQCDFDETIVTCNVSHLLLNAFAGEGWQCAQALYDANRISVEESNRRQFSLLNADEQPSRILCLPTLKCAPAFPGS